MDAIQTNYGFGVETRLPFDEAVQRVTDLLKEEGFGVLTKIDVRETLREKLGVDFRRYVILGACNPPMAHRALEADPNAGLLLPCNVIVYEREGGSTVAFKDPIAMFEQAGAAGLEPLAREARERLDRVKERIPR